MTSVDAIIIASGSSNRMGLEVNKLLLPFGGSNIIRSFIENFPLDLFRKVILVVSCNQVIEIIKEFPVNLCVNRKPEKGKSMAIRLGLQESSDADGILFSVADQPLLQRETIARLVGVFAKYPQYIIVPKAAGKARNPVLFPGDLRDSLLELRGDEGGKKVIENNLARVRYVTFKSTIQFNDVDTPESYWQVLSQWQQLTIQN